MRESASLPTLGLAALIAACSSSSGAADAGADAAAVSQDAAIAADASSGADADKRAGYGEPCTVGDDCLDGFLCLQGPSGGTTGFCTKTCPSTSSAACPDTPVGTSAYCVVTDVDAQGDKGCAFVCREGSQTHACPGALKCETAEDPPGSGQYLCLP